MDNDNATRRQLNAAIRKAKRVYVYARFHPDCGDYVRVGKGELLSVMGASSDDSAGIETAGYEYTVDADGYLFLN